MQFFNIWGHEIVTIYSGGMKGCILLPKNYYICVDGNDLREELDDIESTFGHLLGFKKHIRCYFNDIDNFSHYNTLLFSTPFNAIDNFPTSQKYLKRL